MTSSACCQNLKPSDPSPFEISQGGWQDGLLSGMARCRACDRTYHFEMLDWDEEWEVRIYAFAAVDRVDYDAVVELDVIPISADAALEQAKLYTLRVRDALARSSLTRTLYVASADLHVSIVAAREIGFQEWMSILRKDVP